MTTETTLAASIPDASWASGDGLAAVNALIKGRLRDYLKVHQPDFAEEIHDNLSFDYIGLDSVARVELIAALERHLDIALDPTAAYDFVTVGALARFVWSELSGEALDLKATLGV